MSQQNNAQTRPQPTSYPSPHSYPSPSMSAYAYPPPQQQQAQPGAPQPAQANANAFHSSPNASSAALPPVNLPPIRSIDPRQPPVPAPMGSPMPPAVAPMMGYYPAPDPNTPQHGGITSSPNSQGPLRYPISAADNRVMSGGRHKKEIKRRTKTGCLTCRKRRIKCDEQHPVCRNCQKSKRECLGYDPIFKSQPGPAAIQPAPSSAPILAPTAAISTAPPAPMNYPIPPHGYVPAVTAAYPPPMSTGTGSPSSSIEPYDYNSAIDPALEAAPPAPMTMPPGAFDGPVQGFRGDLKRGLDSASPYSSTASETQNPRAKRHKIDDLLAVPGAVPPTPPTENEISEAMYEEIKAIFLNYYAPSMDKFFETTWYSQNCMPRLLADRKLCDQYAMLVEKFRDTNPHTPEITKNLHDLEMRVIWATMTLCRVKSEGGDSNVNGQADGAIASTGALAELVVRLEIFEALITGHILEPSKLTQLGGVPTGPISMDPKSREIAFWRLLCKYLSLKEDGSQFKEADETLATCRTLLDTLENRDVLYSIAIVRHIGQRTPDFPNNVNPGRDENDPRTKLWIAKGFIEQEAVKATTAVIMRVCEMVIRSWFLPG